MHRLTPSFISAARTVEGQTTADLVGQASSYGPPARTNGSRGSKSDQPLRPALPARVPGWAYTVQPPFPVRLANTSYSASSAPTFMGMGGDDPFARFKYPVP